MGLLKQAIHYHDAKLSEKNYIETYSLMTLDVLLGITGQQI